MSTPKISFGDSRDLEGSCGGAMGPPLTGSSWDDSPSSTAMATVGINQSLLDDCSSDAVTQNEVIVEETPGWNCWQRRHAELEIRQVICVLRRI